MRHRILACKHHPHLRWSCKEVAVNSDGSYNGARNIFYNGIPTGSWHPDGSGINCTTWDDVHKIPILECSCPASDLTFAPEEAERAVCLALAGRAAEI